MEVLTPRTLEEALELKAERPDAVPIQGGTDVMVELNFDRARPEAMLNLNEVAALRGWSRDNGSLRFGAGLTYAEAMEDELAGLLPALAEASRTVGSPPVTFSEAIPRRSTKTRSNRVSSSNVRISSVGSQARPSAGMQ